MFVVLIRLFLICTLFSFSNTAFAQVPEAPPYAKWGRIAIQETKKHYPKADIIDYLHVGGESLNSNRSKETFRLWLKQDNKEWGIWVIIIFDSKTEKVISIELKEIT